MSDNNIGIHNLPMACPKCGRMSDSIKCYSLPNYLLFLGVYAAYEFKREVCCPACMRKRILLKYFTYNIIIGNLLWLFMGLPMGIWKLCSSFTKGHSKSVREVIADNLAASQRENRQARQQEYRQTSPRSYPQWGSQESANG